MALTGTISVIESTLPAKAIPGTNVTVEFNVTWAGAGLTVHTLYTFLIDSADTSKCVKGDKTYTCYSVCLPVPLPDDSGSKKGDITFKMPDKDLSFYLELWDGGITPGTIPSKYTGEGACEIEPLF